MARACVFCGTQSCLTREHVYPAWLRDALPYGAREYRVSNAAGEHLWTQATFDIKARVVCATCNHGWMSDLEAAAGPILTEPMLRGRPATLTPAQQRTVALWAVKTAIVLEASRKERVFHHLPEWHARWMPDTRDKGKGADPPPGVSVVAFGRRMEVGPGGTVAHFTVSRSVGIVTKDPPNDSKGYVATFVVGHLGFQIFGVNVRVEGLPNIWYGPWVTERTTPLWPATGGTVTWPPARIMSTAEVLQFADLWSTRW